MLKVLVFLFMCGSAFSLSCYDCDPTTEGMCYSPKNHNVKITNCQEYKARNLPAFSSNERNQCFVAKYIDDENPAFNGIYRGCGPSCTEIQEDSNFKWCLGCTEDECNNTNTAYSIQISSFMLLSTLFIYILG